MAFRLADKLLLKAVVGVVSLTQCLGFSPSYAATTITRDSFGVPTIQGGDLGEVSRAIGQVFAEDRLWQMFLVTQIANGRAAQYISPTFLATDIFQRSINPTDAQLQLQVDTLLNANTRTAFENYVQGLNDHVAAVNADSSLLPFELGALGIFPVPEFTLNDVLRTARFFLQQFSASQIPQYQLNNIAFLQQIGESFGTLSSFPIFNDLDPSSAMIRSQVVMVPPGGPCHAECLKQVESLVLPEVTQNPDFVLMAKAAGEIGKKLHEMKENNKKFVPGFGSNGQAIAPKKSTSGNPLLRMAPQPNMNHPSDFYEVRVEGDTFTAQVYTVVGIPFGLGIYNDFGLSAQTGHLPTNDFLFESTKNIASSRQELVFVQGNPVPIPITVSTSKSNGWVIQNPVPGMPGTMLTLRSGYFDRQFQGLNLIGELPFVHSVDDFIKILKNPYTTSDIIPFIGQCADSKGDIGGYQATSWVTLKRDRRIPQGIISLNPPASNSDYIRGRRLPMIDKNTKQGYYSGWNTLFDQNSEASGDTLAGGGPGLNRGYWFENVLKSQSKFSFDDLQKFTVAQATANSITAFSTARPAFGADLFVPLFKKKFLDLIKKQKHPTSAQKQAYNLLKNFKGNWLPGNTPSEIANTNDVNDQFILGNAWLLHFAGKILNPYLTGTQFEVAVGTVSDPLPITNPQGFSNNLLYKGQGNLLARLLKTNDDNTVFFPDWLKGVDVDQAILDSLDDALATIGGFAARPWGANKRPIYVFTNPILGPVANMKSFNSSGLYVNAEFSHHGVKRLGSVLPLGESGMIFATPAPVFAPHNFDQLPLFTQFDLKTEPPFLSNTSSSSSSSN